MHKKSKSMLQCTEMAALVFCLLYNYLHSLQNGKNKFYIEIDKTT